MLTPKEDFENSFKYDVSINLKFQREYFERIFMLMLNGWILSKKISWGQSHSKTVWINDYFGGKLVPKIGNICSIFTQGSIFNFNFYNSMMLYCQVQVTANFIIEII